MIEVEDFEKLDRIHEIIQNLSKPSISADDTDVVAAVSALQCGVTNSRGVVAKSGKGEGDKYYLFCRRCFHELLREEIKKCPTCGNESLVTRAERHAELNGKAKVLKESYLNHVKRKEEWARYDSKACESGCRKKSASTNYERWSKWEPETSEDDEVVRIARTRAAGKSD